MNTKQRATWEELVQQCESQSYSSINVASRIRSEAIVAAGKLVELVTPELPALLERLAVDAENAQEHITPRSPLDDRIEVDIESASRLAAHIRKVLTLETNDAKDS